MTLDYGRDPVLMTVPCDEYIFFYILNNVPITVILSRDIQVWLLLFIDLAFPMHYNLDARTI